MNPRILFLALIGAVTALDLGTKSWALTLPERGIEVLPFLNFSLGFNSGVSFGLLAADTVQGYVVLIAFALLVTLVFFWMGSRTQSSIEKGGYAAIVGGALGNLIDRVPDGAVTDFLDAHAGGWHFPTFNLADVAITAGMLLLILSSFMSLRVQRA